MPKLSTGLMVGLANGEIRTYNDTDLIDLIALPRVSGNAG